jgi:N-acetylneuraminic acid mutarotase
MFLRLLPVGQDRLIALGGTGGMTGRTAAVETLNVHPATTVSEKVVTWSVPYEGKAKHSQSLILDGNKLYAFGGNKSWQPHDFSKDAFSNESFQFDIANQTVKKLANMPYPVQSGAGVVNKQTSEHKTLVVAGGMNFGETKFQSLNRLLQYDAKADEWTIADTTLPEPRSMANAVAHDDAIWIFGGSDAGGSLGLSHSVLHWWGDATDVAALPEINLPHPRRSFGGALVGNEYFMVGGLGDGMSIEPSVDVFDMENRTWRTASSPAAPRVFPQVAVDGKQIYLFGGFSNLDGHFTECKTLEVYDSETDQWTTVADAIDGVDASMRLFNLAGRLLFFGVDRDNEQQVKFVMYDPNPMAQPKQVAAMSFRDSGSRGSSEAAKNAKMLMRKDTNKDGKLSADELGKRMSIFAEAADTDGDGLVSFREAKTKMEADEQAEKEANESTEPTSNDSEDASSEPSASTAQQKADELQRAADAAQRAADKAQRAADALRRQS